LNLKSIHNIYFIGIGGIGMSALARYFQLLGKHVVGYDKTPSKITETLMSIGIDIHFEDQGNAIDTAFLKKENTLVVYTPAVPKSHGEFLFFQEEGYTIYKRAELLGLITRNTFCLAVAGTHGKTTTSTILGYLLAETGVAVTAFLGGIAENYQSNLILKGKEISVVEADEFDRSFLQLSPNLACITSMDADHLDIYGEAAHLEASFNDFVKNIKIGGSLFVRNGLPLEGITYGIEDDADYSALNVKVRRGAYVFDIKTPRELFKDVSLQLPGRHNVANCVVAFAMANEYGIDGNTLKKALLGFKGVQRRFSYQINTDERVYIDDYAHHPSEINAVHEAVREMYPKKKVLAIFQPHLYSRTRDFIEEFAKSLSQFDEILLLDIYPARELPIEGVNSEWLLGKINNSAKKFIAKSKLIDEVKKSRAEVIITMGAGDIGVEVINIKNALNHAS
jgi:UDP-N-acetylmuramate--alanine ligase